VSARSLWLRLAALWAVAAALIGLARPSSPSGPLDAPAAVALGAAIGAALFWAGSGRRPHLSVGAAAVLAVSAGAEEIVWRWFALAELAALAGMLPALVASSLAFGAAHPRARAQHAITGLAFGGAYLAGGLLGAWCAHLTYNLTVAAVRRAPPEPV
jgi:membrane protease YdiL (CAAX protease family)